MKPYHLRFLVLSIFYMCFTLLNAQDFVVTDVQFNKEASEVDKRAKESLGTKIHLEVFDNYVKLSNITENKNNTESAIMDRFDANSFIYKRRNKIRAKLILKETFGIIKGAEFHVYHRNCIVYLKREFF